MKEHAPACVCQICKTQKPSHSGVIADLLRPSLLEFIKKTFPGVDDKAFICSEDLGRFRRDYVKQVLQDEIGELFDKTLTFGERLSDRLAEFGGSWRFLICFGAVLLAWIAINGAVLATRAFDPYPFILLNLILSCLA